MADALPPGPLRDKLVAMSERDVLRALEQAVVSLSAVNGRTRLEPLGNGHQMTVKTFSGLTLQIDVTVWETGT